MFTRSGPSLPGILVLLLCSWLLAAGCGGTSTPLYYTAKSSISSQPPPMMIQPQVQAQTQTQTPQPPSAQPQVQTPMPPPQPQAQAPAALGAPALPGQPPVSYNNLQQQLLMRAAQFSSSSYKDYQVGPEDLLIVEIFGQEPDKKEPRERRVNGLGQITMPLVGTVKVGGLTTQEIEARLRELYGSQFLRNPQISVEVKEFHHQRVAVTGAVKKPGYHDIIGPRSLLEVLAIAGGFSNKPEPEAGDVVHVIRRQKPDQGHDQKTASVRAHTPQNATLVINIHQLVSGADPALNVMVENGDVVYVPFAGTAYVAGGVRKPGNVTVKENLTVSQAVAAAQGVDPVLGGSSIIIMRFDQQGRPQKIEADLKQISLGKEPDTLVQNNDTIVVVEGELKKKLFIIRQLLPVPSGGYAIQ